MRAVFQRNATILAVVFMHLCALSMLCSGYLLYNNRQQNENVVLQEHALLISTLPTVVWTADKDHKITMVSDATTELLGWQPSELIGRDLLDTVDPEQLRDSQPDADILLDTINQQEGSWQLTIYADAKMVHKDGHIVPLQLALRGIKHEGQLNWVVSMRPFLDRGRVKIDMRTYTAPVH